MSSCCAIPQSLADEVDCCSVPFFGGKESVDTCCIAPQSSMTGTACPVCGKKGKSVERITLEHLLTPEALTRLKERGAYRFCETPTCEVVYFSEDGVSLFQKPDITVRVGLKETDDPIPVCYCFSYTERMIAEEIEAVGTTTIPDRIRAEVKAGNCRCEVTNPKGSCCLGDVSRAVTKAKRTLQRVTTTV